MDWLSEFNVLIFRKCLTALESKSSCTYPSFGIRALFYLLFLVLFSFSFFPSSTGVTRSISDFYLGI